MCDQRGPELVDGLLRVAGTLAAEYDTDDDQHDDKDEHGAEDDPRPAPALLRGHLAVCRITGRRVVTGGWRGSGRWRRRAVSGWWLAISQRRRGGVTGRCA